LRKKYLKAGNQILTMKTLSKSESMVMESGRRFLRTLDVVGILSCTRGQAGVVLHNLHRKGWLVRVKGGLYADPEKVRSEYSLLPMLSKKY